MKKNKEIKTKLELIEYTDGQITSNFENNSGTPGLSEEMIETLRGFLTTVDMISKRE